MTVPLSPDSARRRHALRFGALLDATLKARGIGHDSLGRQVGGLGNSSIHNWVRGINLPRLETALRIAEALDEPRLADIVRQARTGACETCGAAFLNEGGTPKRFCSEPCKVVRNAMRGGTPTRERAIVAERRLALFRDAVAAYCAGCSPEGLCRDAGCALRPVSPLTLARREPPRAVALPPDGPRVLSEGHRAALADASRRRWGREGERERMSAAIRERFAALAPEERAARARAISDGRRRGAA